jgi:hypothetical protein
MFKLIKKNHSAHTNWQDGDDNCNKVAGGWDGSGQVPACMVSTYRSIMSDRIETGQHICLLLWLCGTVDELMDMHRAGWGIGQARPLLIKGHGNPIHIP